MTSWMEAGIYVSLGVIAGFLLGRLRRSLPPSPKALKVVVITVGPVTDQR